MKKQYVLFALCLFHFSLSSADIYKHVADDGRIYYTDKPKNNAFKRIIRTTSLDNSATVELNTKKQVGSTLPTGQAEDRAYRKSAEKNTKSKERISTDLNDSFRSFRAEAETAKSKLECPKSVDSDITPPSFDGDGALYGCILGKAQTVKWFINENPASKRVSSVKFLWNDWFKDMGYGLHSDKQEAKRALKVLIELYAPEKAKELNKLFLGNTNKTITSAKFTLKYTFDRGPAIDERMIVVTEAIHSPTAPSAETTPTSTTQDERVTKEDLDIRNDIAYLPNEDKPFTGRYETYYPNGNKKGVAHLKDGKYDGLMTLWDENGQNKSETYIKDGVEVPSKEYAEMTAAEKQQVQNDLNKMLKMASPEQIKKLADIVLPHE